MLNSRLFRLQQNQSRHFSTVLIKTNWYTISCKYEDCTGLRDVYCYAEKVPNIGGNAFNGSNAKNATLHVPESSIEKYKRESPWKNFKDIVTLGGEGEDTKPCASPVISYENGNLNITCETADATCYYSMGEAVITSTDYTSFEEGMNLSRDIQLMIYAYATADGYEKSEVVSKQISVPFGTVIKETVTEFVEKWDTAYVNVEVHDTTYVDVEVHDTTYINVEVHDTTYVDVPYEVLLHDTTYVNVEVHDTTYVDVPYEVVVFDTISVPTAQEIPAPTIIVDNGKIEILSGMEDAIIYYTLDGTTPVVSEENRYTEPFTVSGDCTISAIAVRISNAASKEVIDGIWNRPSQIATLRYYRTDGVETDTPTSGVNIVVTQTADGKKSVNKKYIK